MTDTVNFSGYLAMLETKSRMQMPGKDAKLIFEKFPGWVRTKNIPYYETVVYILKGELYGRRVKRNDEWNVEGITCQT